MDTVASFYLTLSYMSGLHMHVCVNDIIIEITTIRLFSGRFHGGHMAKSSVHVFFDVFQLNYFNNDLHCLHVSSLAGEDSMVEY